MRGLTVFLIFILHTTLSAAQEPQEFIVLRECLNFAVTENGKSEQFIQSKIDFFTQDASETLSRIEKRGRFRNWISRMRSGVQSSPGERSISLEVIAAKKEAPKSAYARYLWAKNNAEILDEYLKRFRIDSDLKEALGLLKILSSDTVAMKNSALLKSYQEQIQTIGAKLRKKDFEFLVLEQIHKLGLPHPITCSMEIEELDYFIESLILKR